MDLAKLIQNKGENAESETYIRDALRIAKKTKSKIDAARAVMAAGLLLGEIDSKEEAFEIASVILKTPEMDSALREETQALSSRLERELETDKTDLIKTTAEAESLEGLATRLLQSEWGADGKHPRFG